MPFSCVKSPPYYQTGSRKLLRTDSEGNNDHAQWYGYGNYYTLAAAMANTTNMTNSTISESANTSICPKGWRLPYGSINSTSGDTRNGGFSLLDIELGGTGADQQHNAAASNRWRSYPNNFLYSGRHDSSSKAYGRGYEGAYLSSTVNNNTLSWSYGLFISSQRVIPGSWTNSNKSDGHSVRCLTGL